MRGLASLLVLISATVHAAEVHIVTTPPGAAISVDGALVGLSPRTETLKPGVHTLTAELAGAVASQTLSVTEDEVRTVTLALVAVASPPLPFPVIGAVTFSAGALALGAGLWLQGPAREASQQVSGLYQHGGGWDAQAQEVEAAGLRAQTWSWFLTGTGAVVMASGLLAAGFELFGHRQLPVLVLLPQASGALLCWGVRW